MDIILNIYDRWLLTPYVYPENGWPETDPIRQIISLFLLINIHAVILYFALASFSYFFLYDKQQMNHPLFLKNQIEEEIKVTLQNMPLMSLLTVAVFMLEIHGYSKLYDSSERPYGIIQFLKELITFIFVTDLLIYIVHRGVHHRYLYKHFHKVHHRWIVPTPFASHAFQWLDAFLQSTPYHICAFLFPLHKTAYLAFFLCVNFWTVSIHDGNYAVPKIFQSVINGAAHHNDHHQYYDCNYGQLFTLWDRLMYSFRSPIIYSEKKKNID